MTSTAGGARPGYSVNIASCVSRSSSVRNPGAQMPSRLRVSPGASRYRRRHSFPRRAGRIAARSARPGLVVDVRCAAVTKPARNSYGGMSRARSWGSVMEFAHCSEASKGSPGPGFQTDLRKNGWGRGPCLGPPETTTVHGTTSAAYVRSAPETWSRARALLFCNFRSMTASVFWRQSNKHQQLGLAFPVASRGDN